MILEARVGAITASDGSVNSLRMGRTGELITNDAGFGRYSEAVLRGYVFFASTQAGIAITALNATATGFILSNTAGSGKYLVLLSVQVAQSSAAAAATSQLSLAANVNTVAAAVVHTTPLTVRPALLGGSQSAVGLADSSATLPAAPVAIRVLHAPSVSATATTAIPPVLNFQIDGEVVLSPGTAVSLSNSAALSAWASMYWAEIPILS